MAAFAERKGTFAAVGFPKIMPRVAVAVPTPTDANGQIIELGLQLYHGMIAVRRITLPEENND